jgi:hypothetical protein
LKIKPAIYNNSGIPCIINTTIPRLEYEKENSYRENDIFAAVDLIMQFLYPQLLWALLTLAIPVIIHLFHFRRFKKVYFTNVRFLKEVKEEKSTRRRLRNLLVLLSRLLALAFIIFAFAQPYISRNNTAKQGRNNVSIFIDNSYSMMAKSADVPLIDNARKKAEEIVSAYAADDQFQIISHELKGSQLRWINKENTLQAIGDIRLNPEVNKLDNILKKQVQTRPEEGNHIIYFISDFQKSITDFTEEIDSTSELNLVPLQSIRESNISIDSAWFESVVPALNQNNKLLVRLRNHGSESRKDVRMSLVQNGQNRPEGTVDIAAQSSVTDTLNLLVSEPGWQQLEIRIEDYPVQFDDNYFLSLNIKESIKVLSINNRPDRYINAVFRGLSNFDLSNIQPSKIQYDKFREYDLLILSDLQSISSGLATELKNYVESGGNLMLFPSEKAELESYNNFLKQMNANELQSWIPENQKVYRINTDEFVFENVFTEVRNNLKLPEVSGYFGQTDFARRTGAFVLKFRNGADYLTKYTRGEGHLFVCASPLNKSVNDLVLNAEIFVPLLYKTAFASSQSEKRSYTIGIDNFTEVFNTGTGEDISYKITGTQEFIPGQRNLGNKVLLNFNNMIERAGFYDVELGNEKLKNLAMNYDRLESQLAYYSSDDLNELYGEQAQVLSNVINKDLAMVIQEKDKGIVLWRWCFILALIFLAVETLLLRFWRI